MPREVAAYLAFGDVTYRNRFVTGELSNTLRIIKSGQVTHTRGLRLFYLISEFAIELLISKGILDLDSAQTSQERLTK